MVKDLSNIDQDAARKEIEERVKKFAEGFDKLTKECNITFKPVITEDGPSFKYVDITPKEEVTEK